MTCFETQIAGFRIVLNQHTRDRFSVQYGAQSNVDLHYAQAAAELGACIMHALTIEDKISVE